MKPAAGRRASPKLAIRSRVREDADEDLRSRQIAAVARLVRRAALESGSQVQPDSEGLGAANLLRQHQGKKGGQRLDDAAPKESER